jgi:hypothetical protein
MRSKSYLYFHMTDQYHCLRTAGGEWAVDFVGRVDEPNEDWAEVGAWAASQRVGWGQSGGGWARAPAWRWARTLHPSTPPPRWLRCWLPTAGGQDAERQPAAGRP